jgi:hypothetical protein
MKGVRTFTAQSGGWKNLFLSYSRKHLTMLMMMAKSWEVLLVALTLMMKIDFTKKISPTNL